MDAKMRKAINHFKKIDPVLFSIAEQVSIDSIEARKSNYYFYALCREIIGQQLAGSAAKAIFGRFKKLFPKGKITSRHTLKLSEEEIRNIGTSWAKARYIRDLAQKVEDGTLDLKSVEKLNDAEAIEKLVQVKGIGPWTAEMFLIFTMCREDIFSHGDLGLRKAIIKHYSLRSPDREKIEKITIKWSPYRTYACRILWKSLDAKL
ncbi:MAG: DNA-3-methyladenine glycosylase 2 family protein [Candidatus Aenigmatarchaeota archaeon]